MVPLLHMPPVVELLRPLLAPAHTTAVPVIVPGLAFTLTTTVARHPVDNVYDMVAVPAETAVTRPEPSMAATPVLLLVHVPPLVAFASVVVRPLQTLVLPVMTAGTAFTVSVVVAVQPSTL